MHHVPIIKDLVLIGGGHTHALVLRRWGMKPIPGVRLSLVSRDVLTPYSGMLPGMIAGHYSVSQTHIDLSRLCRWAGVRFINASATALDLQAREIALSSPDAERPPLGFDLLSINTGSTPATDTVDGAADYTVPVKPVNQFDQYWRQMLERLELASVAQSGNSRALRVAIVGAGVGGFELLLSVRYALRRHRNPVQLHWVVRGEAPLLAQPAKVRQLALSECLSADIEVHTKFDVKSVTGGNSKRLNSVGGATLEVDEILWATAASAPRWPGDAGLTVDSHGFIAVNDYLQSRSDSSVFACGDVASLATPVAKAGVFAVRQAPILFHNLQAILRSQPLKAYRAQKSKLNLIALGDKRAIASRNGFAILAPWVWSWKHHIDTRFMRRFSELPKRSMKPAVLEDVPHALLRASRQLSRSSIANTSHVFCGGCGAKVGPEILESVLQSLQPVQRDEIQSGLDVHQDVAILDAGSHRLVQSVDQFRAMLDDPWIFGRINALHALSDVYAARAEPLSAMALLTLPFAEADVQERDVRQLLAGAVLELNQANCALTGGHTGIGPEMMMGFSVNGLAIESSKAVLHQANAADVLIITKPVGVGVVMAADMRGDAEGNHVQEATTLMLHSNRLASSILRKHPLAAMTDVTGFGVLGHLLNLLETLQMCACVDLGKLPMLESALHYSAQGISSSLYAHNEHYLERLSGIVESSHQLRIPLLMDPQTNGGLLAVVARDRALACVDELRANGIEASEFGVLEALRPGTAQVRLSENSLQVMP